MRSIGVAWLIVSLIGCAPIQTVVASPEKIQKGAGISLQVIGPDMPGLEHGVIKALKDSGFEVFSGSIVSTIYTNPEAQSASGGGVQQEVVRKFQTRYLCRIKSIGYGSHVSGFTLQLVNTESGKIILSINGSSGSYSPDEIANALVSALASL